MSYLIRKTGSCGKHAELGSCLEERNTLADADDNNDDDYVLLNVTSIK